MFIGGAGTQEGVFAPACMFFGGAGTQVGVFVPACMFFGGAGTQEDVFVPARIYFGGAGTQEGVSVPACVLFGGAGTQEGVFVPACWWPVKRSVSGGRELGRYIWKHFVSPPQSAWTERSERWCAVGRYRKKALYLCRSQAKNLRYLTIGGSETLFHHLGGLQTLRITQIF